jgi:hypothetical protein
MACYPEIIWCGMTQNLSENNSQGKGLEPKPIRPTYVLIKGIILFLIMNIIFAIWSNGSIGKISLYNHIFPGRLRLPFGENPNDTYNFSLLNLDAMFSSHVISKAEKPVDEFRILLIGDSSTWGILLKPDETIAGLINAKDMTCEKKNVRAYNLGYPTLSLTKDIMILEQAMQYKPDLIIWPVTLEAFPIDRQFKSPLVENNLDRIVQIMEKYTLQNEIPDPGKLATSFFDKTIIGQRRNLADLIRLQLYGVMWAATGIDQVYPSDYDHAQVDLQEDETFNGWSPYVLPEELLAFNILVAGAKIAGSVPILLVNEPILISNGKNSDIRYNFYYPRWAFDQYRVLLDEYSKDYSWQYLDLWDIVPSDEFTNSAIHLTPVGEKILASHILDYVQTDLCP